MSRTPRSAAFASPLASRTPSPARHHAWTCRRVSVTPHGFSHYRSLTRISHHSVFQLRCATPGNRQTYRSFDEMLAAAPTPALVDFYSHTCGPCVLMSRVLAEVAPSLKQLPCRVIKVDVDRNASIAGQFRVQGLPTLILFKDGKEVKRLVGYRDGASLEREVRQALALSAT